MYKSSRDDRFYDLVAIGENDADFARLDRVVPFDIHRLVSIERSKALVGGGPCALDREKSGEK